MTTDSKIKPVDLDYHFLTVTLRDNKFGTDPRVQFQSTILKLMLHLETVSSSLRVYPELTENGNIHYHCILQISDIIKFYKCKLPFFKGYFGHCKNVKVNNIQKCIAYCEKHVSITKEILELPVLPIIGIESVYEIKSDILKDLYAKFKQDYTPSGGINIDKENNP